MRESSLNNFPTSDPGNASQPERKSLSQNILAASPSGSRFYPDHAIPTTHKSLRMNILGEQKKKILRYQIMEIEVSGGGDGSGAKVTIKGSGQSLP